MKRYDQNFKTEARMHSFFFVQDREKQKRMVFSLTSNAVLLFDCYSEEIISLATNTNMKKALCIKTITEAYKNFDIKSGAIIHSNSGSRYTSSEYKKTLGQLHAVQSMSGVGKPSLKYNSRTKYQFWRLLHSCAERAYVNT